jgi:hypothetical protein
MGKKKAAAKKKKKPGPKPETLTIEGDWKDAVHVAMKRGKPPKPLASAPQKQSTDPKGC